MRTDLKLKDFTVTEQQVAVQASKGLTYKEIGAKLFLSHRTVKNYIYKMSKALEIDTGKPIILLSRWVWEQEHHE
jgi:DNA-binding NarL/FixJ family response regulator